MRIKTIICLALSFAMLLGLAACKKSELSIDGEDTYTYTSNDSSQDENLPGFFEYTADELTDHEKLDWDEGENNNDDYLFYIKNTSGVKLNGIAYRPNGYNVFKTLKTNGIGADLNFVKISKDTLSNFKVFDLIILTGDGAVTIFNEIKIEDNRGVQINFSHDFYEFEYLK